MNRAKRIIITKNILKNIVVLNKVFSKPLFLPCIPIASPPPNPPPSVFDFCKSIKTIKSTDIIVIKIISHFIDVSIITYFNIKKQVEKNAL